MIESYTYQNERYLKYFLIKWYIIEPYTYQNEKYLKIIVSINQYFFHK